jgi:transposase-like protein/transposase
METTTQALGVEEVPVTRGAAAKPIREVRTQTHRRFSAEDKIRIILEGFRKELPVSNLCRREGISSALYYSWLKDFMEAGKARLKGDKLWDATQGEVKELQRENARLKELVGEQALKGKRLQWLIQAIKEPQTLSWTEEMKFGRQDTAVLLSRIVNGSHKDRKKALALLGRLRRIPIFTLCRCLDMSKSSIWANWKKFNELGAEGFFQERPRRIAKAENEEIRAAVFSIIHSPPCQHGINRTSWKLEDVCRCMSQRDIHVSQALVSQIVRSAGYKWRKAKTVLTSNDPEYREKLDRIKSILSTLEENDCFCSIDEFGPFAVKIKGGKRLVGPNEYPHVPQFQKSKGWLIVTAALELSQNQVTHFYSKAKNTTEMIKLLDVLLERYRGCNKLYFSWDAASWHASKALYERVKSVNMPAYRAKAQTPLVELAPLPKSAQFLNVIESVFSGMARAIIHNSDYQSIEEAIAAIDRYFQERNEHFLNNPKKAGKKLWGDETVVSKFDESNNCKAARWR